MADRKALIIGASRGIGLGLTRELAGRGWHVTASQRSEGAELGGLAAESTAIDTIRVDVTEPESYEGLSGSMKPGSLDLLLVNAGITGAKHQSTQQATSDEVAHVMMTNTVGPLRLAHQLLPLVKDGGTLAFMTSQMGSIADSSGGYELYRMSKAAQNILARGLFEQFARQRDIAVLSLHPGWVQTDMGGVSATLTVSESVKGLADVLKTPRKPDHLFLSYDGSQLPW
ncbi:SDR family NAD(P)-dependent oxidoreductase [Altererythrobacter sp. SALINAS58]|uniref:SDR family NAD(P)-dependent oxidoreductase n=1 Tax=Alteripontixanthobacter muriae TaxID=2705546 RepID=UPI00157628B6|nr:SDR family NAD(P)-dependent oxidoreductase [Alteripontixanthobacter muriae]NTZ43705.1 SDR family NAD(P)-dependent oxidoreductase [Alteripontixanthobacter muriae]